MYRGTVCGFDHPIVTLHPGEYYSSSEDIVISTILGSCVAVALFDRRTGIGGLNHFMLPGAVDASNPILSPNAKYGMYAMELLINDMMKKGVRKADLVAKVFGAASVLDLSDDAVGNRIPLSNIEFTFTYLEGEGIPVEAKDVGGQEPRKIFFYTKTGKVLLKRIPRTRRPTVTREESEYLREIRMTDSGPVRIFRSGRKDRKQGNGR